MAATVLTAVVMAAKVLVATVLTAAVMVATVLVATVRADAWLVAITRLPRRQDGPGAEAARGTHAGSPIRTRR